MKSVAIAIGCYKLTSFVELNVLRWRLLLPDVPILLSDDCSDASKDIHAISEKYDCDYVCGTQRRSHFSGDMQTFINALIFGRELGVDIVVKCSQRVIPVWPELLAPMFKAFTEPECQIVLPGQIGKNQISRPAARFYARFGILSDLVAMRVGCIEPDELLAIYRARNSNGKPSDSFSETTLGTLLATHFSGNRHRILPEWTNHRHGERKLYLRKSQSTSSDYVQIAAMSGIKADVSTYPLAEWREIELKSYKPKAEHV